MSVYIRLDQVSSNYFWLYYTSSG